MVQFLPFLKHMLQKTISKTTHDNKNQCVTDELFLFFLCCFKSARDVCGSLCLLCLLILILIILIECRSMLIYMLNTQCKKKIANQHPHMQTTQCYEC